MDILIFYFFQHVDRIQTSESDGYRKRRNIQSMNDRNYFIWGVGKVITQSKFQNNQIITSHNINIAH